MNNIEDEILKQACKENDAQDSRKFKISQILEGVVSDNEKEFMIDSFLKSKMPLDEVEKFAAWRKERDAAPLTQKTHAGVS